MGGVAVARGRGGRTAALAVVESAFGLSAESAVVVSAVLALADVVSAVLAVAVAAVVGVAVAVSEVTGSPVVASPVLVGSAVVGLVVVGYWGKARLMGAGSARFTRWRAS